MKWGKHATDWTGSSLWLLDPPHPSSAKHPLLRMPGPTPLAHLIPPFWIHQLQLLSGEWEACRKVNLAQGVREGMDRGHGQSKVNCCSGPAWPSRIQKGQLLVWVILSEARSHHQETQDAPWSPCYCSDWLGQWGMIQEPLFCIGSTFGRHTKYPHMKPSPGAVCAASRQNEPACSRSLEWQLR